MKIKEGYLLRQFGDECVVVAVGDGSEEFNRLITINSVGAFIYRFLQEEKNFEQLVQAMTEQYDADEALIRKDAENFVAELRRADLLDD